MPKPARLVSAGALRWIVAGARNLGVDERDLLAAAGLDATAFEAPDTEIPSEHAGQLLQSALQLTVDPAFGLHAAVRVPRGELGLLDYIVSSATSGRDSLEALCRYFGLVSHGIGLHLRVDAEAGHLEMIIPDDYPDWTVRASAEFTYVCVLTRMWERTGLSLAPRVVAFRYPPPAYAAAYAEIFCAPVRFAQPAHDLVLPLELLETELRTSDSRLHNTLRGYADRALSCVPPVAHSSVSAQVRRVLKEELQGGSPDQERICRRLATSPRSLRRRLEEEGTTFEALRTQLRSELARDYLSEPAWSISEVAFLLGFSEAAAFYRAFKRWTGVTPQAFRRRQG